MTRSVEVYLKSENDAESVRASLQTVKVKNLFIDEMGEESRNEDVYAFLSDKHREFGNAQ